MVARSSASLFSLGVLLVSCRPSTSPPPPSCPSGTATREHPVDVNTADVATLMTLPGIGVREAREIVRRREAYGPALELDELATQAHGGSALDDGEPSTIDARTIDCLRPFAMVSASVPTVVPALSASSEASLSEPSFVEGPLPDALLVEREVEAPPPRTRRGRPIVLRELDAPPTRHVVWVARDGALTSIDDAAAETADPRPLPSGGFRYVRVDAGARELVTVDADGRVVRSGRDGAGRVPAIGGHHSPRRMPFTDDGRFGTEQDVDEGSVVVRDFVSGASREAALPASGTPSAIFVGDDGAVLVCSSTSNGRAALRSGARDLDDVGGRCVAASRDLSWVVVSVDDAALIARRVRDGHRVSLPPGQLAAFDAHARFVVVARFDEASSSTVLTRVSLSDGAQAVLASVPSILDTLEIARDDVIVVARLPWPPDEAEPARAFVVRLGGGELASFALPGGTSVVVHVPRGTAGHRREADGG